MSLSVFDLIAMLPRSPEKRSTPELLARLAASGHTMTPRSLQRRLMSLLIKHTIVCDDRAKPYGWSIAPQAPPTLGAMSVQEAVTLKLAERYLREAIPADLLEDIKHYATALMACPVPCLRVCWRLAVAPLSSLLSHFGGRASAHF